jgi:hypothetical protein
MVAEMAVREVTGVIVQMALAAVVVVVEMMAGLVAERQQVVIVVGAEEGEEIVFPLEIISRSLMETEQFRAIAEILTFLLELQSEREDLQVVETHLFYCQW